MQFENTQSESYQRDMREALDALQMMRQSSNKPTMNFNTTKTSSDIGGDSVPCQFHLETITDASSARVEVCSLNMERCC
jgi:hypothetical protein